MDQSEFASAVDEDLVCGICDGVFIQPHSCPEGHTYCESCLKTWVREKKNCPECRMQVNCNLPQPHPSTFAY